jgi:hypothetical protein
MWLVVPWLSNFHQGLGIDIAYKGLILIISKIELEVKI